MVSPGAGTAQGRVVSPGAAGPGDFPGGWDSPGLGDRSPRGLLGHSGCENVKMQKNREKAKMCKCANPPSRSPFPAAAARTKGRSLCSSRIPMREINFGLKSLLLARGGAGWEGRFQF